MGKIRRNKSMDNPISKNFLDELLLIVEVLIYLVVTIFVLALTYVDSEVIGQDGTGFLPIDIYRLNPFMLILGLLIFTALTVLYWEFLLRKQMFKLKSKGLGWFIAGIILLLVAGVLLFFDTFFSAMVGMGLFAGFESEYISAIQFLYPVIAGVGYPLVRTLIPVVKQALANRTKPQ